jgi:tRNA/tmRNA/rRNA uracil-C5-methylase (TrmA/RlmC/RlmD family)
MTLGRDLVALRELGMRPHTVLPLDLMPHTAQVECVAVLERA